MPIVTKCRCGKQFAAPDHLVGKRVKCPGCQQAILIPPSVSKAAATEGGSIPAKCGCGKAFAAPAKLVGKSVKCPGCGQPLTISAAGQTAASSASRANSLAKCQCGHAFQVPDKLAGKSVRCPACKKPVQVPGRVSAASRQSAADFDDGIGGLLDEVGFQRAAALNRCPECKEDLDENAVICVHCGYNLESGRKLKTKVVGRRVDKLKASSIAPNGLGGDRSAASMPSSVKVVVLVYMIQALLGILAVVGFLGMSAYTFMVSDPSSKSAEVQSAALVLLVTVVIVGLLVAAIYYALATSLKKGSKTGWIVAVVLSCISLIGFPIGTLIGGGVLYALFKKSTREFCS